MISDKYINGQACIDRIEAKEINKENCQLNEVEKSELDRRCMGIQVFFLKELALYLELRFESLLEWKKLRTGEGRREMGIVERFSDNPLLFNG